MSLTTRYGAQRETGTSAGGGKPAHVPAVVMPLPGKTSCGRPRYASGALDTAVA